MKLLDVLSRVSVVLVFVLMVLILNKLDDVEIKSKNFYEYKNTKINLNLIKNITPRVDYIITYKEDKLEDIFRSYSTTLDEEEINNIHSLLDFAQKSEFYSVEIIAYMKFDERDVELFLSDKYVKKPSSYRVNQSMLTTLRDYGIDDFQYNNLVKLQDKVYESAALFYEDVTAYAKLKKDAWTEQNIPLLGLGDNGVRFAQNINLKSEERVLTQEDVTTIIKGLEAAYSEYKSLK